MMMVAVGYLKQDRVSGGRSDGDGRGKSDWRLMMLWNERDDARKG